MFWQIFQLNCDFIILNEKNSVFLVFWIIISVISTVSPMLGGKLSSDFCQGAPLRFYTEVASWMVFFSMDGREKLP